jgi:predicted nucleic acid-binding protein
MPVQALAQVANGTDLFIDANIFLYAIGGRSSECQTLLERCSREEVAGICSYSVIVEATHQFMLAEAKASRIIPEGQQNPAKYLRSHPDTVKALRHYWASTRRLFSLNLVFLETEEIILRQAQIERQNTGLLTIDSVIVACMREYGIRALASNDRDFERVAGNQLFRPRDVN